MKRSTNNSVSRILGLVIGVSIAMGFQHCYGQSAAIPKAMIVKKLESDLNDNLAKQQQVDESIDVATQQRLKIEHELNDLKKLESAMSVSVESFPEVLKTLHSQRVQLSIDLAGIDARYTALLKAIDQVGKQQTESLIQPIQQMIKLRELDLARLKEMFNGGRVDSGNVRTAELALLEAKTRLAQVSSPAGGALARLNEQLLDTTLDRAEKTARLEKTNSLVGEVDAFRIHLSNVDTKQSKIKNFNSRLSNFKRQRSDLDARINSIKKTLEGLNANLP